MSAFVRAVLFYHSMKFNRQQFLDDLRELADCEVRWRHQGSSPETGMDCIGVIRYCVEKQTKLPQPLAGEFSNYTRPPNGRRFLQVLRAWLIEVGPSALQPADLVCFFRRRNPQHMAVVMEQGIIGEAYESADGATSKFLIRPIPHDYRIAACFRIPDEF